MGSEGATSDAVCVSCEAGKYGGKGLQCSPCPTGTWSTGSANAACTSCSSNQYLDVTSTGANCPDGDATKCPTAEDHSAHCKYCDAGNGPADVDGGWPSVAASVQCVSCSAKQPSGAAFNAWQTVTGGAANDGCQGCPHFHELNASSIAKYAADANAATTDWSSHCSRACPAGEMKSELYASCVGLPKPMTALPYVAGKEQRVISECEAGHIWASRTSQCERCPANFYALPGATSCTPCESGTTSSAGASGCILSEPPACSASEVLAPRINDYDCLLRQMTNGGFSCDTMMNALWASNALTMYANGMKRLCSKTIHDHAHYYETTYEGFYDVYPDNGNYVSRATELRKLTAEAHAEWGLDDDYTLQFWLLMQGIAPTEKDYVGPLNTGCATMDGLRASGAGFSYITQQQGKAQAAEEPCAASRCADPRFTRDWCAYPLFAVACPVKCGGVPAATITCGAATTPVSPAGGVRLPLTWEFSKPIQPRSMLACGPGWAFNTTTRLVEPACGRPEALSDCPDEYYVLTYADGKYTPSCNAPPPSAPPPPPSTETVVVSLVAPGSVSEYQGRTDDLKQAFATVAGVDSSAVEVTITAASVRITATIAVPGTTTATAMTTSLKAELATAELATAALGFTVESVPVVTKSGGGGDDGLSAGAIAGIVIGVLVGVALIGAGIMLLKRNAKAVDPS